MNINTGIRPDTHAAAQQRKTSPASVQDEIPSSAAPGEYAAPVDTVEISADARVALQARSDGPSFTQEDVAPLKERFSKLLRKENNIFNRLSDIMSKLNLKRGGFDQVKVEIDSSGKAIVGGVSDVKTARALEEAINGDKQLLQDIVDYQAEEDQLSKDMRDVTGKSLKDFDERIETYQRKDPPLPDTEDAIALKDQSLYAVDSEFARMISERYAAGSARMDISGRNNILEDAEGTVNRMMRTVTGKIAHEFKEMNKAIRMDAAYQDDPAQYVEDSIVNLTRLEISVDNTGALSIEGIASKNNPKTDKAAKKIIAEMFEKELETNPATGEQHDFKIAAAYLLNAYDETFGEGNPLGLNEAPRTLETTYSHGEIESHVSSPEREAELAKEIDKSAKDALKDMGIDATDLVIEMNDSGKLVATNLDPNAPDATAVQTALETLNVRLDNRSVKDAQETGTALGMDPVKRLKGLMSNMDVFRPGGAGLLRRD